MKPSVVTRNLVSNVKSRTRGSKPIHIFDQHTLQGFSCKVFKQGCNLTVLAFVKNIKLVIQNIQSYQFYISLILLDFTLFFRARVNLRADICSKVHLTSSSVVASNLVSNVKSRNWTLTPLSQLIHTNRTIGLISHWVLNQPISLWYGI